MGRADDSSSEESSSQESSEEANPDEGPETTDGPPDVTEGPVNPDEETTILPGRFRRRGKRSPRRGPFGGSRLGGFQQQKEQLQNECLADNEDINEAAECVMEAISGKFCGGDKEEGSRAVPSRFNFSKNRIQQRMRSKVVEKIKSGEPVCTVFNENEQDECKQCFQDVADPTTTEGFEAIKNCGEQYLGEAYAACADEFDLGEDETIDMCTLRPALSCMALQKCKDAPNDLPDTATDEEKLDSILQCMKGMGISGRRTPRRG